MSIESRGDNEPQKLSETSTKIGSNTQEGRTTRLVNGEIYNVVEIPQEDPENIRKLSGIKPDYVGSKPMMTVDQEGSFGRSHVKGRKAPSGDGLRGFDDKK